MEKKLAVIVDNKKVTTEAENIELCSSACDVAMETCSSQSHDTCGVGSSDAVLWKIRKIGMLDHKMLWFEGKNWSKK